MNVNEDTDHAHIIPWENSGLLNIYLILPIGAYYINPTCFYSLNRMKMSVLSLYEILDEYTSKILRSTGIIIATS